ncbi:MAG: hypothetical protein AB1457_05875 [Chloroflexota bacterium]
MYEAAEWQVNGWPDEARFFVPLIVLDLDRYPDLGRQFKVQRAPTLLLLDETGRVVFRQNDIIRDDLPLDLETFEQKIREMKNVRN